MFGFRKKSYELGLTTDLHSHLLPGLDDGVQDFDESLDIIRDLHRAGYKDLYITPHIKSDIFPNSRQTIEPVYNELREKVSSAGLDIRLHYAAEYFLNLFFCDNFFNTEQQLITLPGNHLLLEMSMRQEPMSLFDMLFKLQNKGYRIILAHPERYTYYLKDFSKYHKLKKAGCIFQLNMFSVAGYYGNDVKKLALELLKNGMVDLLGTDIHKKSQTALLQNNEMLKRLSAYNYKNNIIFK